MDWGDMLYCDVQAVHFFFALYVAIAAIETERTCVLQQWDGCVPLTHLMQSIRPWPRTKPCASATLVLGDRVLLRRPGQHCTGTFSASTSGVWRLQNAAM